MTQARASTRETTERVLAAIAVIGLLLSAAPAVAQVAEPELLATPQGPCGSGSRPETGIQGRVARADHDSGRAAEGFTCNTEAVGAFMDDNAFGTVGGFKVHRYVDDAGNECAYYDSTLLFPTNLLDAEGGVNVLDMADPSAPVRTDRLITPAMLTPHESLVLSEERGILAAVTGNPATNVGIVDVYDVSADCRSPVFRSSTPFGVFGHESGLSPDGMTFYSAGTATQTIVAIDLTDPALPVPISFANVDSHGLSLSADGTRAYVGGTGSGLIILDTSEVQERVPAAQMTEISTLDWTSRSIPQNAVPFTRDGREYVVEIDEFGGNSEVGAGRIIDIEDETAPRVVSNLRLEVHQPEHFDAQADDPGAMLPVQGYGGHYCSIPTRVDPDIVACSMILSGLRIFDIRDVENPVEVAYFNAPVDERPIFDQLGQLEASNWAMAAPAFAPERNEVWYSDGFQGFWSVRVTNDVWNGAADLPATPVAAPPDDATPAPSATTTPADPAPVPTASAPDPAPMASPALTATSALPATGPAAGIGRLGRLLLGASLLLLAVTRRRPDDDG